jgi:Flp pilus assembly pilin Flp
MEGKMTMGVEVDFRKGRSVRKGRRGGTLVEVGALVGLVAVVAIGALSATGGKVNEIFGGTSNAISLGMNGMLPAGGDVNLAGGVAQQSAPPTITTTSLPAGASGSLYSAVLAATTVPAGNPVTWSTRKKESREIHSLGVPRALARELPS